jgi:hypothetical protein
MATAPESPATVVHPHSQDVPEREPNLARFGLRQLFFFFSLATIFAAVLARLGGVWPVLIGCVAALVAAHLLGTFLGTRLRDTSHEVTKWKARPGSPDRDEPVATPQPVQVAALNLSAPPLASHEIIGRRHRWWVAGGAIAGAVLGAAGIFSAAGDGVTAAGIALGSVSCGIIGAWAALLGANFYMIARHTLRQASNDLARDHSRRS